MNTAGDPWAVLADRQALPGAVEQALADLSLTLFDLRGPGPAAPAAVPRLISQLEASPGLGRDGAALISLLARLALGDHPWPAPDGSGAHLAVREALAAEVPRLLPLLSSADARTRHLLAHLLAWLTPSVAIDAALREQLSVEKYEAGRASLLLALSVRLRGMGSSGDRALLRSQLVPNAPLRVVVAAAVGLCLFDPAAHLDPPVRVALRRGVDAPDLANTELAWNRGTLQAMASGFADPPPPAL